MLITDDPICDGFLKPTFTLIFSFLWTFLRRIIKKVRELADGSVFWPK